MTTAAVQGRYAVRFEWGLVGATAVLPDCDAAVVVDVLSFTTAVSVAVDAGMHVWPHRFHDEVSARALAERVDAVVAVGRRDGARTGAPSLSPASLRTTSGVERLVLPSPNGSAITEALGACPGLTVYAACLRNAARVAGAVARSRASRVAVIAAGERWPDGSLRPAVEDLWGAGAVLAALQDTRFGRERADGIAPGPAGPEAFGPEALMAADAWRAVADDLPGRLRHTTSGVELVERGFGCDVEIAAEVGQGSETPILRDGRYVAALSG